MMDCVKEPGSCRACVARSVRWWCGIAAATLATLAAVATLVGDAAAQTHRRAPQAIRRSQPPSGPWGKTVEASFLDDAFTALVGPRPNFSGPGGGGPGPTPGAGPAPDSGPVPGGFRWSALISEGTLADEVKDMKEMLAAACDTPSAFKGGGFNKARRGFSVLALAFGVVAAYDEKIRWQKDAMIARDLFARAGFNCKVGTDQSFAEAKARLEDLDRLLQGSSPASQPEPTEGDFAWSSVAGRAALMGRLEEAQTALRPAAASAADFKKNIEAALHAAEVVAVIGEVIQQRDFEFHDDDTYRGYSAEMRDAAAALRKACQENDYDAARAAASRIEKSCNTCHGDYRG